jgi:hypothetical protein
MEKFDATRGRNHFENVIGVKDWDRISGEEFEPNVLDFENPMVVGNFIVVADGRKFEYRGEDNLGRSIFTLPGVPLSGSVLFSTK